MWQVRLSTSGVVEETAAQAVGGHVPTAPCQYLGRQQQLDQVMSVLVHGTGLQ